jgi:hypothetical protein
LSPGEGEDLGEHCERHDSYPEVLEGEERKEERWGGEEREREGEGMLQLLKKEVQVQIASPSLCL